MKGLLCMSIERRWRLIKITTNDQDDNIVSNVREFRNNSIISGLFAINTTPRVIVLKPTGRIQDVRGHHVPPRNDPVFIHFTDVNDSQIHDSEIDFFRNIINCPFFIIQRKIGLANSKKLAFQVFVFCTRRCVCDMS